MRLLMAFIACLALMQVAAPAMAQGKDVAGQWQSKGGGAGPRMLLMVRKNAAGGYAGEYYLMDNSPHPKLLDAADFKDGVFTFTEGPRRYRGELSADGDYIKGAPFDFERSPKVGGWSPPAPVAHTIQKVTVDDGVTLEVVDWGGSGPPLIFLAGLGEDAHVFDLFAPRFKAKHRVYGISRRGFGASDKSDPDKFSYSATRLADDVLQVMAQLKIEKPTLAGWSIAGGELSSIGTRMPDKVAGLVYLEAGYTYAFYAPGMRVQPDSNLMVDVNDLRERLRKVVTPGVAPADSVAAIDELLAKNLPELKADLETARNFYASLPAPAGPPPAPRTPSLDDRISRAILMSEEKFTGVKVPVLAFYGAVMPPAPDAPQAQRERIARLVAAQDLMIRAFEAAHPHGRVIRLVEGQHAVFNSHPDEVFREMDMFMDGAAR